MPPVLDTLADVKPARRRAPWRQRLIDTERGLRTGLRGDSTLFFYLFVNCTVLLIGGVLDLSFFQWLLVGFCITLVMSAELMQQSVRALVEEVRALRPDGSWTGILNLATASVSIASAGGSIVVVAIYAQRLAEMFRT